MYLTHGQNLILFVDGEARDPSRIISRMVLVAVSVAFFLTASWLFPIYGNKHHHTYVRCS